MSEKTLSDSVPEENDELTETIGDEKPKRTRGRRAGAKKSRAQASRENGIKGGIAKKKINEIKKETDEKFDGIERSAIDELEKLLNPPKEPETTGIAPVTQALETAKSQEEPPKVQSVPSHQFYEKMISELAGIKASNEKISKRVEYLHNRKKIKSQLKSEKPEVIPPKEKSPPKKVVLPNEDVSNYLQEMGIKLFNKK